MLVNHLMDKTHDSTVEVTQKTLAAGSGSEEKGCIDPVALRRGL
jgi:hypothetical protein